MSRCDCLVHVFELRCSWHSAHGSDCRLRRTETDVCCCVYRNAPFGCVALSIDKRTLLISHANPMHLDRCMERSSLLRCVPTFSTVRRPPVQQQRGGFTQLCPPISTRVHLLIRVRKCAPLHQLELILGRPGAPAHLRSGNCADRQRRHRTHGLLLCACSVRGNG
jgi:hypothetical protein